MNRFLLSIALLGFARPAAAQQQQNVPATLSLADALRIAREHNPTYLQAVNNRGPAAWANRNAFANLIIPQANAQGTMSYSGTGSQRFLSSNFSQTYATVSSSYFIGLDWQLSGATLSAPGLRKAQLSAADADIDGARATLESGVTQQYLTVLQARDNVGVQQQLLTRNQEFLRLAQARYAVGQATLIDVRQAQVALGQAEVTLLRAQTQQRVEKLRLFEQIGVSAPTSVDSVQLTDTFPVTAPAWKLNEVLTMAEAQNPALQALRARERSAAWGVRSASSSWGPSLDVSAGWSGFTQQLAHSGDLNSFVNQNALAAQAQYTECNDNNTIRQNNGLSTTDCSGLVWTNAREQALRDQNRIFPFNFIGQPFQARLTVTLPLWTNFATAQTVAQAKATQQNLEESVRARALGLQTEVSLAYYTLQTAFQSVAIQDTNRVLAREQLQLATDRYRVGSGTFFELLDAQVTGLRAETDYISAVYDYHKAVAQLEAAVGRPLR
ncbi:MAG TPA: TolC family protein [Gemmatimonadales bacterium]|nr:TolC family protein [Gemmatimonadales bacterium]